MAIAAAAFTSVLTAVALMAPLVAAPAMVTAVAALTAACCFDVDNGTGDGGSIGDDGSGRIPSIYKSYKCIQVEMLSSFTTIAS